METSERLILSSGISLGIRLLSCLRNIGRPYRDHFPISAVMNDRQIYLGKLLDDLGFAELDEEDEDECNPKHMTFVTNDHSYGADVFASYFEKRGYVFPISVDRLGIIESFSENPSCDAILSGVDTDEGFRCGDSLLALYCKMLLRGGTLIINTVATHVDKVVNNMGKCGFVDVVVCHDAPGNSELIVGKYMPPQKVQGGG